MNPPKKALAFYVGESALQVIRGEILRGTNLPSS